MGSGAARARTPTGRAASTACRTARRAVRKKMTDRRLGATGASSTRARASVRIPAPRTRTCQRAARNTQLRCVSTKPAASIADQQKAMAQSEQGMLMASATGSVRKPYGERKLQQIQFGCGYVFVRIRKALRKHQLHLLKGGSVVAPFRNIFAAGDPRCRLLVANGLVHNARLLIGAKKSTLLNT